MKKNTYFKICSLILSIFLGIIGVIIVLLNYAFSNKENKEDYEGTILVSIIGFLINYLWFSYSIFSKLGIINLLMRI